MTSVWSQEHHLPKAGASSQSLSLTGFILQASTGISTVLQVVTIDWFSSRRKCEWGTKWPTNDVKGNIGRRKSTVYVPVSRFTGTESLKTKSLKRTKK